MPHAPTPQPRAPRLRQLSQHRPQHPTDGFLLPTAFSERIGFGTLQPESTVISPCELSPKVWVVGRDDDWYRRKTWTHEDQRAFFDRLKRSRGGFHRAQYTRIQAYCLQETGKPQLVRASLALLDRLLTEWPDDSQLAAAYHQQGESYEILKEPGKALASYRAALTTERDHPGFRTQACLSLAWLIATTPFPEFYEEALQVIEEGENGDRLTFPAERYRSAAAKALIHAAVGESTAARQFAKEALEATEEQHSGLRHHPTVGLVSNPDKSVLQRLEDILTQRL